MMTVDSVDNLGLSPEWGPKTRMLGLQGEAYSLQRY